MLTREALLAATAQSLRLWACHDDECLGAEEHDGDAHRVADDLLSLLADDAQRLGARVHGGGRSVPYADRLRALRGDR